jgi:predicted metal-dependent peptidase
LTLEAELKNAINWLWGKSPFLGYLLLASKTRLDPKLDAPAATDGKRRLYINPKHFELFKTTNAKCFVLAHEVLHIALRHSQRAKGRDMRLWNIATDAVDNNMLSELFREGYEDAKRYLEEAGYDLVDMDTVARLLGRPADELKKMSAEEIYELLVEKMKQPRGDGRGPGGGGKGEPGEGEEFGERGDMPVPTPVPVIRREGEADEGEEAEAPSQTTDEDFWRRVIAEAAAMQKAMGAGRLPASLEALLKKMRPKVRWKALLRSLLMGGITRYAASTYRVLHRKFPYILPGEVRMNVPTIWCVVDTSGSMVGKYLDQMVAEVFSIADRFGNAVRLVAWEAKKATEVSVKKLRSMMRLPDVGGGTEIMPALQYLDKKLRRGDALIIMTDGDIADIGEADVQGLMRKLSWRAAINIFLTTLETPRIPPRYKTIKIEVE